MGLLAVEGFEGTRSVSERKREALQEPEQHLRGSRPASEVSRDATPEAPPAIDWDPEDAATLASSDRG